MIRFIPDASMKILLLLDQRQRVNAWAKSETGNVGALFHAMLNPFRTWEGVLKKDCLHLSQRLSVKPKKKLEIRGGIMTGVKILKTFNNLERHIKER